MSRSSSANHTAIVVVSAALLALAIVLVLWQQVDRACTDGPNQQADPIATCDPVPSADIEQVPSGPTA